MFETSGNVYSDSFNLDLAEHYSSTYTKSNFRSQSKSLDLREACILSPSLLLGLLTALKLGVVVVGGGGGGGVERHFSVQLWPKPKLNKNCKKTC